MSNSNSKSARNLTPVQAARQARVLACTRDLLAEEGYDGLQMRVLAERAEVALMTLYNRFGNKDDLILVSLQALLAELTERASTSGKQGIEFILHNGDIIADQIVETPRYAKAMALMLFNGQIHSPIVKTLLATSVKQNLEQVQAMIDLGEITDQVDPNLLANTLSTCTWSIILLWMKQIIADKSFKKEYLRAPILVLAPAMTPNSYKRYCHLLK